MNNANRIKNIRKNGKTAYGQRELIKHLEGHRLTLRQAVNAHCFDCMGFFADGKNDCRMPHCSLHPFMTYNENRVKRTGQPMTEDRKAKMKAARRR